MDEESSITASYLFEVGLAKPEYWLSHFKKVGLTSISAIDSHENDMNIYSTLTPYSTSDGERKALRKIFKIVKREDFADSTQTRQQSILQIHMEKRMGNKSREALDINKLIEQCSGGLMLQGIFLTKNLEDQLKVRRSVIGTPKNMKWREGLSSGDSFKICSTKLEENSYKNTMMILGCGIVLSANMTVYGDVIGPGMSMEKCMPEAESYASTLKYFSVHAATCCIEIADLELSKHAKVTLRSVLSTFRCYKKINTKVVESCMNFFETFGSHVNLGPVCFGGHVLWTCSNAAFLDHERDLILKAQHSTISSAGNNLLNTRQITRSAWSESSHPSNSLEVAILGGPSKASTLSQWKSDIETNSRSWIVTDRGKNLVAIWDIIKINHEEEFGEIKNVLKISWEKRTGLKGDSNFQAELMPSSEYVVDQVSQWSLANSLEDSIIQQNLEHLLKIKCAVSNISGLWTMKYISQGPIQIFLLSIVNLRRKPPNLDRIRSIMCDLVQQKEANELIKQGFLTIEHISEWLYTKKTSESEKIEEEEYNFSKFNRFLIDILEEKNTSHSKTSQETLALMVGEAIQSLRFHYGQSYEDILISILVQPFRHTYRNVSTMKPLLVSDIENMLESFLQQESLFDEYQSQCYLLLQSKLLILAIDTVKKTDITSFLEFISKKMRELQPPLEERLLQCLKEYFQDSSIPNLRTSLNNLFDHLCSKRLIIANKYSNSSISQISEIHESCISKSSIPSLSKDVQKDPLNQQIGIYFQKTGPLLAVNSEGVALLKYLGLMSCYNKKLNLQDALCIKPDIIQLSVQQHHCVNPKQLPYLILHKLMSYDSDCRSDLLQNLKQECRTQQTDSNDSDIDDYIDSDDEDDLSDHSVTNSIDEITFKGINPIDCLLAILLCCDDFLRQDLFCRLAKCQIAVPFIIPDPISMDLMLPLWAMKSIINDWNSMKEEQQQQSHPVITYPMPVVSFIRFGKHKKNGLSKSQILNKVISDEDIRHYFYRGCPGGQHKRVLGEGVVDMSWYLPSGKQRDPFKKPITFLNLHGDAHQHHYQAKFLSEISTVCFIMLVNNDFKFEDQDKNILLKLNSSPSGLTILNGVDEKPRVIKKEFPKSYILNLTSKTEAEINDAIRNRIKSRLEKIDTFSSIEDLCRQVNDHIIIDENSKDYRNGFLKANEIQKQITRFKRGQDILKKEIIPLQGKDLWQSWAALDKELNRQIMRGNQTVEDYSPKIEKEKSIIRVKQLQHVEHQSPVMKLFIGALFELQGDFNYALRNYFLQCLKLELNALSRESVRVKQQLYLVARKELLEIPPGESGKAEERKKLKQQLEDLQDEIIESSFGLEHLLREVGQVYEAAHKVQGWQKYCTKLSRAAAELLIDGYPLEIMDGDAAQVPLEWVKAVLSEVVKLLGDHKVFVLSVLGLQSTGKSTMLNTTFGLQFNVSAGRCTRGVFMQILPLDDALKESTGCSYIFIVDTEGLRAPELDPVKTQKHDNELATFVIGLANMTLINIYGEVPGDMDDILQTSVHAFLRMHQVKYYPSCQFVHQNAGVNIKGEVGRAKFTKKLNKFTVDAAREEQCEGQYESFNQVIKFDDQTDVHYFKGLWKGDPPMAPVNHGYSHAAQTLKNNIVQIMCSRALSKVEKFDYKEGLGGLTFSLFSLKIFDLWQTLLKEKFVFSFKNTLEITAYNSLENEYSKLDWEFQLKMLDWEHKATNEIDAADLGVVTDLVENKFEELQEYVLENFDKKRTEMETFFNGQQSEILIQWKANFELKLQNLSADLRIHAEECCKKLLKKRQAISEFETMKNKTVERIKLKVQENIETLKKEQTELQANLEKRELDPQQLSKLLGRDLFSLDKVALYKALGIKESISEEIISIKQLCGGKLNKSGLIFILFEILTEEQVKIILKHSTPSEGELKEKFDELWKEVILQLSYHHSNREIDVPMVVQSTLIKCVKAQGGRDGQLISQLRKMGDWAKGKCPALKPSKVNYTKQCGFIDLTVHYIKDKLVHGIDRFQMKAEDITNAVLREANERVEQISKRGIDFQAAFVEELLRLVDDRIVHHTSEGTEYKLSFTPDYKNEVYLRACSSAIPKFEEMAKLFDDQNDPLLHLEKFERAPLFTKYKNQYKQTENEEAIADTLSAYLEEPLKVQVRKTLGTKIVGKMKTSKFYYLSNKMALKVKILLDLHNKGDFKSYMLYIKDIQECLIQYITRYTVEFSEEQVGNGPLTQLQATAREEVSRLIGVMKNAISKINMENNDLQEWLLIFCKDSELISELGLNLKVDDVLKGYDYVQDLNLNNLKKNIMQLLHDLERKTLKSFENITCQTEMVHWTKKPHELLKSLIGCPAQCPFCGEQCDLMEHEGNTQLHRTEVHRIDCLAGWREKQSQIMATGFCPALVASDRQFYKANQELHHYKNYRSVYTTWSIPPNVTSKSTLYWKWFVNKYRIQLAEEYIAKPVNVPEGWSEYEWNDVKEDLENVYNITKV